MRQGGHNIPEEVIRRRFAAGLANFEKYRQVVDSSTFYECVDGKPVLRKWSEMSQMSEINKPENLGLSKGAANACVKRIKRS